MKLPMKEINQPTGIKLTIKPIRKAKMSIFLSAINTALTMSS